MSDESQCYDCGSYGGHHSPQCGIAAARHMEETIATLRRELNEARAERDAALTDAKHAAAVLKACEGAEYRMRTVDLPAMRARAEKAEAEAKRMRGVVEACVSIRREDGRPLGCDDTERTGLDCLERNALPGCEPCQLERALRTLDATQGGER